jgi:hypothetical protein
VKGSAAASDACAVFILPAIIANKPALPLLELEKKMVVKTTSHSVDNNSSLLSKT